MTAVLMLGLLASLMTPWIFDGNTDDDTSEDGPINPDPEEQMTTTSLDETPEVPEASSPNAGSEAGQEDTEDTDTLPLTLEFPAVVEGTEGSDVFNLEDAPRDSNGSLSDVTLSASGGDDILDLIPETGMIPSAFGPDAFFDSSISGGDGDDLIEISASGSSISGGDGNDTITAFNATGTRVLGGAGDDPITATENEGDTALVAAGSGNDTIDGREINNGQIDGDEGDDIILFSGADSDSRNSGNGFSLTVNGGAGDDILVFDTLSGTSSSTTNLSATGGEGADAFRIIFDPDDIFDAENTGTFGYNLNFITDFQPGIDTLELATTVTDGTFVADEIQLIENQQNSTTNVIARYTSDTEMEREVVFTLNALGVDVDDIVLLDGATLQAVA